MISTRRNSNCARRHRQGNRETKFVPQIRTCSRKRPRVLSCKWQRPFFTHPHLPAETSLYGQSGPANTRAGNSICELFNFHRLFISQLATRYYGTLNYYTYTVAHTCAYVAVFGSHDAPFRKRAESGAHSKRYANGSRTSVVRWRPCFYTLRNSRALPATKSREVGANRTPRRRGYGISKIFFTSAARQLLESIKRNDSVPRIPFISAFYVYILFRSPSLFRIPFASTYCNCGKRLLLKIHWISCFDSNYLLYNVIDCTCTWRARRQFNLFKSKNDTSIITDRLHFLWEMYERADKIHALCRCIMNLQRGTILSINEMLSNQGLCIMKLVPRNHIIEYRSKDRWLTRIIRSRFNL